MTLAEALKIYIQMNEGITTREIQAFVSGWTAKEVSIDILKN